MNARANYAKLVDGIFGAGTATFDITEVKTNHVIGALLMAEQYTQFCANFEHRLRRLAASLKIDSTLSNEIHAALNKLVTSEWDGAYAELCALDYFFADALTGQQAYISVRLEFMASQSQTTT